MIKRFAYIPEPKDQAKLPKVNFVVVLRSHYKKIILFCTILFSLDSVRLISYNNSMYKEKPQCSRRLEVRRLPMELFIF
jgi:hypothetical protein